MSIAPSGQPTTLTRMQLYELLAKDSLVSKANTSKCKKMLVDYILQNNPHLKKDHVTKTISLFSSRLVYRWISSGKNKKSFKQRYNDWLMTTACLPSPDCDSNESTTTFKTPESSKTSKQFDSLSTRSKRRRIKDLVSTHSPEELVFASQSSLTKCGKRNVARVMQKVATLSPRTLRTIRKGKISETRVKKYTADEALALFVDTKLTKAQYLSLRQSARKQNCNMYPSYGAVLTAKKRCYPEDIYVSETKGEISLQSLVNHMVYRLATVQSEVIRRVFEENDDDSSTLRLTVTYKWGFDGSSNHSVYKQKFMESCGSSDSDLLLTSIVPLKVATYNESPEQKIIWKNPRPSSTRFCVPIKIEFIKESVDIINEENKYVEQQIANLCPSSINMDGMTIIFEHVLMKTMLDGKVANALAGNPSTQSCYICKIKPKEINNLEKVLKQPCNYLTFNYGLSTLHAHIRLFECILHIAYRLDIKKWQVRGEVMKKALGEKKRDIKRRFRVETGLLVDTVKQGSGNTNDGNTARRFFKNPQKAADITKVDVRLIHRFATVLQAISCGYKINSERFREYALETAKLYISLYDWYKMPASVHKILIHGADVMEKLIVPIGSLSEEALEARHKECRYFRLNNTRKIGRKENIEDLLHALLISSDMVISSMRPLPKRKLSTLSKDVIALLEI